jgi:23S rRNA (pseudouridine1915-N3)-methyltransferase
MKITLLTVGKTDQSYLIEGMKIYYERLKHYIKFETIEIQTPKSLKSLNPNQLKESEGKLILKQSADVDMLILLDEKGTQYTSEGFASWIQKTMNSGIKHLVFVVGGAYGFSEEVYSAASGQMALSKMTFSHQMARLFFVEQLYRAFTILRNEPYHNS